MLVESPLVSVVMMTRNHEAYIEQAVRSVAEQGCPFDVELLIGEDYSSDETLEVCKRLQRTHPEVIRLIFANRNVGITPNFLRLVSRARGRYVALLEGDDYWTDNQKLAKQVALMESDSNLAWCAAKTENRTFWVDKKPSYGLKDTLRRYIFHTSTVMFRREIMQTYPDFPDVVGWISMVYAYLAQHGRCGFIDEYHSYYRHHAGGLWTGKESVERIKLAWIFTETMNAYFGNGFRRELADRELWICSMETGINLEQWTLARWISALRIARLEFSRLCHIVPGLYMQFVLRIIIQPVEVMMIKLRRTVGIRTRWRTFMKRRENRK